MLKLLLVLLCIYLLIRMFTRNMVATSFSEMQRKMQEEMKRRAQQGGAHNPEGHVSVNGQPKQKSGGNSGEYVDYEEIK
ncbi:MAG: hypothetical protein RL090_1507 [Bacteroidota bacterium]|jgi:sortase (surface protein transpeptidase)